MSYPITNVTIEYEHDVVLARQRAREIAALLGFDNQDQTRIATAVSELARNAFVYAGRGKVEFEIEGRTVPQLFVIRIGDRGPGIANLKEILEGRYASRTGMGIGLVGARRLVDQCEVHSDSKEGTKVALRKIMPRHAPLVTTTSLGSLIDQLAQRRPQGPLEEIQQQNRELVRALAELRERQDELARINRELEDTNRGVVALYAELDEKASHLRRADEMKSRFLSNMSHEFRTPLNSILALSGLLLDRADGELTSEQDKQVGFIRKGAETLMELVNDLLDLAKIEAGKVEVQPVDFEVANLFSALRGMLRPLLVTQSVGLAFEDPGEIPCLYNDEGKLSQILRNFISNALKFTEQGVISVAATFNKADQTVTFSVADTGMGITAEDQSKIFEEFVQLDNPAQRKIKGTGLGLPLCRKLATLLNGKIDLVSQTGIGSTFSVIIPLYYSQVVESQTDGGAKPELSWEIDETRLPVLVLEDAPETRLLYEKFLRKSLFQFIPANNLGEARRILRQLRPRAIVMDILLRGEDSWSWLAELKAESATREIPVLVITSVDDERKGLSLGADAYCLKPIGRDTLIRQLQALTGASAEASGAEQVLQNGNAQPCILIIDDEPVDRYILVRLLEQQPCIIEQAASGFEGLRILQEIRPDLIFLDLNMPGLSGYEVLDHIKAHPATRNIPVAVVTSAELGAHQRQELERRAYALINKVDLSAKAIDDLLAAATAPAVLQPPVVESHTSETSGNG
ncbi:MAG TPA: ATP-binding protein [Candidatus Polarisedimenticolaceae bacterium]|nr:ATP-binding protein [Candidatus Polarisedimenticolaceae bacterium]